MNALPLFSLFAFIVMLVQLPILFGELLATSLAKLHLSPEMALLLMMAIIIGGLVNIPVRRIAHERVVPMHPLAVFGLGGLWPEMARERPETIIAINFGGCVVPAGLALRQLFHLATTGSSTLFALFVAATIYVAACYFSAQPVQGVGIVLLGLLPAAVAALMALLFAPREAAPVAYIAVSPDRSSAPTCCISRRSNRALSAWPASVVREPSTVLSCQASWPPIWRNVLREQVDP